jgi:hypothetical protein
MFTKKALAASVSAPPAIYVEDVFSTFLYTGNDSTQTITNGIDLAGEGGLVWSKARDQSYGHRLLDSARTNWRYLESNSTAGENLGDNRITPNSDGFTLNSNSAGAELNVNGAIYASWTFRKAEKFFDVVTFTQSGTTGLQNVGHNLGSTPGCVIVKTISASGDWWVWHRYDSVKNLNLASTNAAQSTLAVQDVTSTSFNYNLSNYGASNGTTYVAYLFAHDAGGFGDSGTESVSACGTYTGNGSATGPTVTLNWEPQWLLVKRTDSSGDWQLIDNMRGFTVGNTDSELNPNLSNAESTGTFVTPLATGFQLNTTDAGYNASSATYIYIAIRRGLMKTPTSGTEVFQSKVYTGTNVDNRLVTTDIVTDMVWARQRNDTVLGGMAVGDRLRGQPYSLTGANTEEVDDSDSFDQQIVSSTEYGTAFSSMTGFWVGNDATSNLNANTTANNHVALAFCRAPGFFDVVAYTGTGSARTVPHNLGVVPELIIVKRRLAQSGWQVYSASLTNQQFVVLNTNSAKNGTPSSSRWNSTNPTSSVFSLGTDSTVNASGSNYIAYLFASCPGVSKVGSYTGTGTTKDIDCGFTNGARFVLIKRTDETGDWYIWDTARGIVSGNDPYLLLNSTAAEVTSTDYIDPLSSGFQISSTAPAAINASGGSFIFLAIA